MSQEEGEKVLNEKINTILQNSQVFKQLQENYRKELNSRYHILDLSFDALYTANAVNKSAREKIVFTNSYNRLIDTVKKHVKGRQYISVDDIPSIKDVGKLNTFFVSQPIPLLISPSFDAARNNISAISALIADDKYFGKSDRVRTLDQITREEGKTLEDLLAQGRYFKDGIEYVDPEYTQQRIRYLSKIDLGHTPGFELGRDSPLKEQFKEALGYEISKEAFDSIKNASAMPETSIPEANSAITTAIINSLWELATVQANCVVEFKNELPEKFKDKFGEAGFLSLTLQLYTVNNKLSIEESRIRNTLIAEIKNALRKVVDSIPGSNTLRQDVVQATEQLIRKALMDGITGKGSAVKLKLHDKLTAAAKSKSKNTSRPSVEKGKVKTRKPKAPKIPTVQATTRVQLNLTSLQRLLDANLVQQIKQNMGDGSRKDILNLRSGRFAESVKVERLSKSRQGMITAFYTYMKNPYATFAEGGRQQNPASRNPKLLISKSIREIATQQVANRLRAVSI